ncbi:MAG: hypothetical protein IPJ41_02225 [Phycisphaerales bacterium]|nr:hypothetical protein [Phycisphaerales bacterium]
MLLTLYTAAALLALAWLALSAWALFADRSRGRPRCPKCFHSLEGIDVPRCPECGRELTDPRSLHRTHRHWRIAALALILLLVPALIAAGSARVKQAGAWVDLPTSILVRLQGIDSDPLHKQLVARVKANAISRPDARRVALRAAADLARYDRRQNAFEMLEALAANSYSRRDDDQRPTLAELEPHTIVDALLARIAGGDAKESPRALMLLSTLNDADERATLALATALGAATLAERRAAEEALANRWRVPPGTTHRPGSTPRWIRELSEPRPRDQVAGPPTDRWLGSQLAACNADPLAALPLAKKIALGQLLPSPAEGDPDLARAAGLWLWCRLDRSDAACMETLQSFMDSPNPQLRLTAVGQLIAFDWSDHVADVLRKALADPDTHSGVQFEATVTIKDFGRQAQPLVPDLLAYAGLPRAAPAASSPRSSPPPAAGRKTCSSCSSTASRTLAARSSPPRPASHPSTWHSISAGSRISACGTRPGPTQCAGSLRSAPRPRTPCTARRHTPSSRTPSSPATANTPPAPPSPRAPIWPTGSPPVRSKRCSSSSADADSPKTSSSPITTSISATQSNA